MICENPFNVVLIIISRKDRGGKYCTHPTSETKLHIGEDNFNEYVET